MIKNMEISKSFDLERKRGKEEQKHAQVARQYIIDLAALKIF